MMMLVMREIHPPHAQTPKGRAILMNLTTLILSSHMSHLLLIQLLTHSQKLLTHFQTLTLWHMIIILHAWMTVRPHPNMHHQCAHQLFQWPQIKQ